MSWRSEQRHEVSAALDHEMVILVLALFRARAQHRGARAGNRLPRYRFPTVHERRQISLPFSMTSTISLSTSTMITSMPEQRETSARP